MHALDGEVAAVSDQDGVGPAHAGFALRIIDIAAVNDAWTDNLHVFDVVAQNQGPMPAVIFLPQLRTEAAVFRIEVAVRRKAVGAGKATALGNLERHVTSEHHVSGEKVPGWYEHLSPTGLCASVDGTVNGGRIQSFAVPNGSVFRNVEHPLGRFSRKATGHDQSQTYCQKHQTRT